MERISRFRSGIILALFLLVVVFFGFKLYDLQVIETKGSMDNTDTFTTYTRIKAARGDILDCNGNLLVSNRASYDLVINHYVLLSANGTNDYLYRLVQYCKSAGVKYSDHFPISQERPFTYTLDDYSSAWQSYFQSYLAYKGGLDSDITAPLLVSRLRTRYRIPDEWSDEEARLVIGLRYEMDLRSCVQSLSNYVFQTDADDDTLSAVVELNIPGMTVEASTVREYNTKYAAHILGYVGAMNAEQWEYYKDIKGYEMDAEVGQDGLEKVYEEYLHGVDGLREDTVMVDGTLVSSRYLVEPKAGSNVEVSIDINVQREAEERMREVIENLRNAPANADGSFPDGHDAEGGAAVAINTRTGQILACASYPTYDLSRFFTDYEELSQDPYKPFYNRALLGTYPPGSTYKMSMVVAGINSHTIDSKTTIYDRGVFDKYPGFKASCLAWSSWGGSHQDCTAAKALQVSCNYFFYELGDRISLSVMDETAKGLGLGERTGVELPEYIGQRANKQSKAELHEGDDKNWYAGDQVLAAIGQSDNRFSPIQLCVYASTLANRGTRYKATFMSRVVSSDYRTLLAENNPTILSQMEISDEAYNTYKEGMHLVASTPDGTAYSTFRDYPIAIAAKTGTAQTGISGTSDNGAFVCFAPLDEPEIAIAVYIEKGGHGSTLAKIAKSMLDTFFDVDEIGDVTTYENKLS